MDGSIVDFQHGIIAVQFGAIWVIFIIILVKSYLVPDAEHSTKVVCRKFGRAGRLNHPSVFFHGRKLVRSLRKLIEDQLGTC